MSCRLHEVGVPLNLRGKRRLPARRLLPSKPCATLDLSRRLRMDGNSPSVSPTDLHRRLGTASAPVVVDVRRAVPDASTDRLIVAAFHAPPDDVERWRRDLPAERPVVVYCRQGHEVSQGVTSALRAAGVDAAYLEGGIAGWVEQRLPTRRIVNPSDKWVTREHPKIDRIACPWLISRFVNPLAEFI